MAHHFGAIWHLASDGLANVTEETAPVSLKIVAALLYGGASLFIVFANKLLFASPTIKFPSFKFVALCQYVCTVLVLLYRNRSATRQAREAAPGTSKPPAGGTHGPSVPGAAVSAVGAAGPRPLFPPLSAPVFWAVMPLPLIFFFNTVTGLGATMRLNVPMYVLLRRFSIVMTMAFESYLLARSFTKTVKVSVFMMVIGAAVAAFGELQLDVLGYSYILANDFFTALQGVVLRKKLDQGQRRRDRVSREQPAAAGGPPRPPVEAEDETNATTTQALAADSLLFYNALFSVPLGLLLWVADPVEFHGVLAFTKWTQPYFLLCFLSSMFLGFGLNYSYFLCTKVNSPLTTTVIGSMKNVMSSYLGMLVSDYGFTVLNFVGVNIGVLATLIYSAAEITKVKQLRQKAQAAAARPPPDAEATTSVAAPATAEERQHHAEPVTGATSSSAGALHVRVPMPV